MALDSQQVLRRLRDQVAQVLRGKESVIELAVCALLARGHLLVEDVPGVGKTTLARALSKSIGATYRRIQFTADLMPTDILGASVYDPRTSEFRFFAGPVFTQVLLADELNRATPRTQSALLEAMDERRVTLEGVTRVLEEPFFVIATQNPEEFFGTFPLPESQLDRFLLRVSLGYPDVATERAILANPPHHDVIETLSSILDASVLLELQRQVMTLRVEASITEYVHRIVLATREHAMLSVGASTRAALGLDRAARAMALLRGRDFVIPDDVRAVASAALAHRIRLRAEHSDASNREATVQVMKQILEDLAFPV